MENELMILDFIAPLRLPFDTGVSAGDYPNSHDCHPNVEFMAISTPCACSPWPCRSQKLEQDWLEPPMAIIIG